MAILLGAAFLNGQRTVAKHSRSLLQIEITALQLPRASRPTHLKTPPGKCKARFAMYLGPVDILTRQAPMPKPDLILVLPRQRTSVTAVPATAVSQTQGHPMVNHPMSYIDRVRVQVPWALLDRPFFLLLFPYCTGVILWFSSSSTCIYPSDPFSVECFRFLGPS